MIDHIRGDTGLSAGIKKGNPKGCLMCGMVPRLAKAKTAVAMEALFAGGGRRDEELSVNQLAGSVDEMRKMLVEVLASQHPTQHPNQNTKKGLAGNPFTDGASMQLPSSNTLQ